MLLKSLYESLRCCFFCKALCIIPPDGKRRRVAGVTSIDDKLYVIRIPAKKEIQVYRIDNINNTYEPDTPVKIDGLDDEHDPWERGFTSCARRKCLYVSDKRNDMVYAIHVPTGKVEPLSVGPIMNGAKSVGPTGLSVNSEGNEIGRAHV